MTQIKGETYLSAQCMKPSLDWRRFWNVRRSAPGQDRKAQPEQKARPTPIRRGAPDLDGSWEFPGPIQPSRLYAQ